MIKLRGKICPIEQWLNDPYYVGSVAKSLRPFWRQKIIEYFKGDKREFLFTGSQRLGKSFCTCVIIMRYIYEIYFVEDFPTLFGLDPTTLPKIIFFSFSKAKADSTGIDRLIRLIDKAPWFNEGGRKRRQVQSFVEFPWVQVLSGVNESHATGEDLLGAILDEANVRHVAKDNQLSEAQQLFTEIVARSYTTFSWQGVWKGFSGLISTTGKQSSFIDTKLKEAKEKGNRFIVQGAIYDFAPEKFSPIKFDVCIGEGDIPPFIVDEPPVELSDIVAAATGLTVEQFLQVNPDLIIHPPIDLKRFYQEDINYALANLSGITRIETSNFFKKQKELDGMFDRSLPKVCYPAMPNIGIYDNFDPAEYFKLDVLFQNYHGETCYAHNDISAKNDRTGMSIVYLNQENHKICTLWHSFLYYDRAVPDNEIDQTKVIGIYRYLIQSGVKFGKITADQYASLYVLQQLKLLIGKEKVERQSVDADATQYLNLLTLARKQQICFHYDPLIYHGYKELVYDRYANKVDHPHNTDPVGKGLTLEGYFYDGPAHLKDCQDADTGAVYLCTVNEQVEPDSVAVNYKPAEDDFFNSDLTLEDDGFYQFDETSTDEYEDDFEKFDKSLRGN